MTLDADAILTAGRLPEDNVQVCTRGDLVAEYARIDRELAQARLAAASDPRVAGTGATELVARLGELRAEIERSTVTFRLRALSPKRWLELAEQHPPRKQGGKTHPIDEPIGVNNDTFFPALIRLSTVEPKLRDETWDALLDPAGELLNQQQRIRLGRACWDLNKREPDVPFSFADWLSRQTSDSGSPSPAPSASAPADLKDGNPLGSPSTSTTPTDA